MSLMTNILVGIMAYIIGMTVGLIMQRGNNK